MASIFTQEIRSFGMFSLVIRLMDSRMEGRRECRFIDGTALITERLFNDDGYLTHHGVVLHLPIGPKPAQFDHYFPRQVVMRFLIQNPEEGIKIAEPYYGLSYAHLRLEKEFIEDEMSRYEAVNLAVNPAYLDYLEDLDPEYRLQEEAFIEGYPFRLPDTYKFFIRMDSEEVYGRVSGNLERGYKSRVEAFIALNAERFKRKRRP